MKKQMQRNIKLMYAFKALGSSLLVMPVIVPFFNQNGLNQTQIFLLQSAFAASAAVMEVPSGYIADRIGRRKSLVAGSVLAACGFGVYSASFGFWQMLVAELVLGVALSFISGADSALAFDSLLYNGYSDRYRQYEANVFSFVGVSEAVASLLGGLIALISLRTTLVAQTAVYGAMIPVSFMLTEPERHQQKNSDNPFRDVVRISKYALSGHHSIKWLILYGAVIGTLTHTMVWLIQPYYELVGIPLGWYGLLWAVQLGSVAVFARLAASYESVLGTNQALSSFVLIGVASYLTLGLAKTVWVLPVILGFYFIRAVFTPIIKDKVNNLIGSDIRATVLSVQNLAQKLLYVSLGPIIGWVMDVYSLPTALMFSAAVYGGLGLLALLLMKRQSLL